MTCRIYKIKENLFMNTITFDELKAEPDQTAEYLYQSKAPCLITREGNRNLVILSQREYDSVMETIYLLKSPANAERLLRSLAHAREGKLTERDLIEE
jgi:antitoxin YefM